MATAQATPLTGRTAWARNLAAPVRDFLSTETGSAIVLLAATIAALLWANSPWPDSYESVWTTELSIRLGDWALSADLRDWVNDGLMTLLLPGRRPGGQARARPRRAARPQAPGAARRRRARRHDRARRHLRGASTPAADGGHGWGAAMSTDTAFALGLLALAAPRGATRLRVFLLTLAVVDDLCALLVIATAYSENVSLTALADRDRAVRRARRAALRAGRALARPRPSSGPRSGSRMFKSGIHPTIAGLAIGLVTSAYPPARGDLERASETFRSFREQPTPELARTAQLDPDLGDLGQRAPAVPPAPVDELRDRPALRARQRRHHLQRRAARRRAALAGDARDRRRLRRRQARRDRRRLVAGDAPRVRRPAPAGQLARASAASARVAGIGFTVSLLISSIAFQRSAARGGEDRHPRRRGPLSAVGVGGLPPHRPDPGLDARAPAERHRRRAARPRRRRRPRGRPPARQPRRARDPARVRRLRVPVLRPGRDRRPRAARRPSATSSATSGATCRSATCTRARRWRPRWPRRRAPRAASGRCTTLLLTHQDELLPMHIRRYAEELGLDVERFWRRRAPTASTRRASPATSRAPTRAASRARRRSSSTAAATRAPTTSRRSPRRCAPRSAR